MSMLTPLAPPPVESCDRMLPKGTAMMAGSGASGGMKPAERAHLLKRQQWSPDCCVQQCQRCHHATLMNITGAALILIRLARL